ncbi:hypothetical protein [Clostridium autoethanogenum]|uniref:hypothetical protein n=1 Tax=Clostridium autoethanogenum TaxID=84023 RepID=UPI001604FAEF|nr:hypothetical protein [Clostridium autoethanogenum]
MQHTKSRAFRDIKKPISVISLLFFSNIKGKDVSEKATAIAVSTMKNQDRVWLVAKLQIEHTSKVTPYII